MCIWSLLYTPNVILLYNDTFWCFNKGNKADCNPNDRMVKREEGELLAKEYSVTFMETSAKSGFNVEIAFMAVARYIHQEIYIQK